MDIAPAAKDHGAILGFLSPFGGSKAHNGLQSEHSTATIAGGIRYGNACVAGVVVGSLGGPRRCDRIAVGVPCFAFFPLAWPASIVRPAMSLLSTGEYRASRPLGRN